MRKIIFILFVSISIVSWSQSEIINGNLTVNGVTSISTNSDAILSFKNTDDSWQYMQFIQNNIRKAYVGLDNGNNFVFGKENGGSFYFFGGNLNFMGDNLGVGTSNPLEKLHVEGNVRITNGSLATYGTGQFYDSADAQLRLRSSDTWNGIDFQDVGGRDFLWFNGAHKTFALGGGGSNVAGKKLHVEGGTSIGASYKQNSVPTNGLAVEGNVGIGVFNPTEKLVINGNVNLNNQYSPASDYLNPGYYVYKSGTIGYGMKLQYTSGKYGTMIFGPNQSDRFIGFGKVGTALKDDEMIEFMRVDLNSGNLGIGTITPSYKLDVIGAAGNTARFTGTNGQATLSLNDGSIDNYIVALAGSFRFRPSGVESMTLSSNGNLGIGTTSPTEKLEIFDTVNTPGVISLRSERNDAGHVDAGRISAKQATIEVARIGMPRAGEINSGYLTFWTKEMNASSLVESMRINEKGNVGIGVSNPVEALEIYDGNTTSLKLNTTDTAGNYQLKITARHDYLNKFSFNYGPTAVMQEKVITDVGGVSNSKLYFSNYYGVGFGTHTTNVGDKNQIDLYISGSGDTNGSGNVGIGTTTPDSKLAVNGKIHAKEVKVDLIGWPDYVFTKEYNLLSVKEVEDYIKKHGHLPKMPSAKKVEKEGVLLGEMNKKFLEKIEELTLYTIEQEKRIKTLEEQNKRISNLEKQLKKLLEEKK